MYTVVRTYFCQQLLINTYYVTSGLLEHQQAIQEDMVDKWRLVLQEIQRATSASGGSDQRGADAQARLEAAVAAVRSVDEYARFVEMHKTPPPPAVHFGFEVSATEAASAAASTGAPGGSLQELDPNGLVLNESTSEILRARLQENEVRLAECRSQIQD